MQYLLGHVGRSTKSNAKKLFFQSLNLELYNFQLCFVV